MKRMFLLAAVLVLIISGCSILSFAPVKIVSILGTPYTLSDFTETGEFIIALIAMDGDSNPVELNSGNIEVVIDSVVDYYGTTRSISAKVVSLSNIVLDADEFGLAMLFDGSGSMSSSDPYMMRKTAAENMLDYLDTYKSGSQVGLFDFAVGYDTLYYFRTLYDFAEVGSHKAEMISALDSLMDSGGTPLYDAMTLGCRKLGRDIDNTQYKRVLMTLTDGGDNESYYLNSTASSVIQEAKDNDVTLFNVALGDYAYTSDLLMMADSTDGIFVKAQDENDLENIFYQLGIGASGSIQKIVCEFDSIPYTGATVYGKVKVYKGLFPQAVTETFEMVISGYYKGKSSD